MASIPRQASDSERQRGDGGPRNEVRSQQSARAESFDADESFESPLQSGRACEVTEQRVTRTAAETRLPEVASRFQPGMDEINHERSGTLHIDLNNCRSISVYEQRRRISFNDARGNSNRH